MIFNLTWDPPDSCPDRVVQWYNVQYPHPSKEPHGDWGPTWQECDYNISANIWSYAHCKVLTWIWEHVGYVRARVPGRYRRWKFASYLRVKNKPALFCLLNTYRGRIARTLTSQCHGPLYPSTKTDNSGPATPRPRIETRTKEQQQHVHMCRPKLWQVSTLT